MPELLRTFPDPNLVLAVDGGASKVDVAMVDVSGKLIGAARRSGSYHFGLGHNGSLDALEKVIAAVGHERLAGIGVFCLAGADLPVDDRRIAALLGERHWTGRAIVRNDTFAVLRAGTDRAWGVAVVCGTGMNCAGVGPDGRSVRFPSFGELSGDRAHGGGWLGRSALGVAIRARDRRGPRTSLEELVPAYFGMTRPTAVMEAVYLGTLDQTRLSELAPTVFKAAAAGDAVARSLTDEMADEIVATVNAAIRRLHVANRDVQVVLGGGVFRSNDRRFLARIRDGIAALAADAVIRRLEAPPVLGAALIGLDQLHASVQAEKRLRVTLTHRRLHTLSRG